jgi:predicted DsbA family dithiol-disulfide isomerase
MPAVPDPSDAVTIDLWGDLGCPWCYVGSRRLQLAVARETPGSVAVRWRAHPSALRDGSHPEPPADRLVVAGLEVGLRFDLGRTAPVRDTRLAQRAVLLYEGDSRQRAVLAGLFAAAFEHARDVADPAVVADVTAAAAGDPARTVARRLADGEGEYQLARDARDAARLGVDAVPTYVVGGVVAVRGDQQPATLRRLVGEARRLSSGVASGR